MNTELIFPALNHITTNQPTHVSIFQIDTFFIATQAEHLMQELAYIIFNGTSLT